MGAVQSDRARLWDDAYRSHIATEVSWFQADPAISMDLISNVLSVGRAAPIVDVGGGASLLVDHLVKAGFVDLTVLDISEAALHEARQRVGEAAPVTWLHEDILCWHPATRVEVWHDRAAFHFLTEPVDRDAYLRTLRCALRPGGVVVIGTFAADGPQMCSGLPVARYSRRDLIDALGPAFEVVEHRREEHVTPSGTIQPFTWIAARSRPAAAA